MSQNQLWHQIRFKQINVRSRKNDPQIFRAPSSTAFESARKRSGALGGDRGSSGARGTLDDREKTVGTVARSAVRERPRDDTADTIRRGERAR
jgi:hypothetical protein